MIGKSFLSIVFASQALAAGYGYNKRDGPGSSYGSAAPASYMTAAGSYRPVASWMSASNPYPNKPSTSKPTSAPTAVIDCGSVVGTTTSLPAATASVNKFLGLPFAQSPPQRFSPPQKIGGGSCNIDAKAWKPACIQQFVYPKLAQDFTKAIFNSPAPEESEDCLYLNLYAPASPPPPGGKLCEVQMVGSRISLTLAQGEQ